MAEPNETGDEKKGPDAGEGKGGEKKAKLAFLSSPGAKIGLFVALLVVNAAVSLVVVQKVIKPRGEAEAGAAGLETPGVEEPGDLFVLKDILVNPAGTRATRHLRLAAALEYDPKNQHLAAELERRRSQFLDLFITELSARTVDELVDARRKEEIREELLAQVNANVNSGTLTNLYFTEYVMQ